MKKLFVLAVLAITFSISASAQRFAISASGNNTGTALNYAWSAPSWATSTITTKPNAFETTTIPAVMTYSINTVNVNVGDSKKCDILTYVFKGASALTTPTSTAVATYTINFSTGFSAATYLTCDSNKTATARFIFDGVKYRQLSALKN